MKKLSMILFVTWSILLVSILTFGASTASKITSYFSDLIYGNKNELKDVEIENRQYIIGKEYVISPTIYPATCSNPDLEFTSLDPDVFKVEDGIIIGNRLESNINIGTLLVTSKSYPEFRKEIELIFNKTYPKEASIYIYNEYGKRQDTANVYIHKPFQIVTKLTNDSGYVSEKNVQYEYDQNLFDLVSKDDTVLTLKPKYYAYQIGTPFTAFTSGIKVYVNGTHIATKSVIINPWLHAEAFTNAVLSSSKYDTLQMNQNVFLNSKFFVELYNDDVLLSTPFTITSRDEEIIKVNENNELEFIKLGTASITITLNNGFSKTYNLTVRNKIEKPIIYNNDLVNDTIHIYHELSSSIDVRFENDIAYNKWSYEVIGDSITASIDENGSIVFEAQKVGESAIVITIDDGVERPISSVIKVVVDENPNAKSSILKTFGKFLAKIAGHLCFFILEAFLAYFMMIYYKTNKRNIDLIIYFGIGLTISSLTEFIQIFMPGRNPAIKDILIDMTGYLIGFGCSILFFYLIKKIKNKKVLKNE